MKLHSQRWILAGYRYAQFLYPAGFRDHCAGEMQRCAALMLEEDPSGRTVYQLAQDFVRSLLAEHFSMNLARIPQLVFMLVLTTFVAGTAFFISKQVLRMNANDPQVQLAEDAAARISGGDSAHNVVPERQVNIDSSLAPFVIVYDGSGNPVASSAMLDGRTPVPPHGVFDAVLQKGEVRVTWQPRRGVRIASVVTKTASGFVVAGRNMREVEIREDIVFKLAGLGWLVANITLILIWLIAPLFGGRQASPMRAMV
jgi:hypothetical protein